MKIMRFNQDKKRLTKMKTKLKYYIEIPFLADHRRIKIPFFNKKNRHYNKIDFIPISAGIILNWSKYEFDICDMEEYFPKGKKKGKHIFSLTLGISYFSIKLTIYR